MLRERARLITRLTVVADVFAVASALYTASLSADFLGSKMHQVAVLAITLPVFAFAFYAQRLYASFRLVGLRDELTRIVKATGLAGIGTAALSATLDFQRVRHFPFALFLLLAAVFVTAVRLSTRIVLRRLRGNGYNSRNVVIVGRGKSADDLLRAVYQNQHWGLRPIGQISPEGYRASSDVITDLAHVIRNYVVDVAIFAVEPHEIPGIERALQYCNDVGIEVHLRIVALEAFAGNLSVATLGDIPLLSVGHRPMEEGQEFLKRLFDAVVAAAMLIVFGPLMLIVGAAIRFSSSGPALFRQTRVGKNGRHFVLYKFRTMVADAEQRRSQLAHANEMKGPVFKIKNDPRITPLGRWLRKTSVDELPQLFNVLLGHMSLVGPRPPLAFEVEQYEPRYRRRLSVRPGLTGLWQVSGRNSVDFDSWMELDLRYIDNWSWKQDLQILAKTVPAMLDGQ